MSCDHLRHRGAARRGFTLVELIVAGIIAALVIGAITSSLSQLGNVRRISKERHDMFLRADAALRTLRREIVSVIRSDDLFDTRLLIYSDGVGTSVGDMPRDEIVIFNTRLRPVRDVDQFTGEGVEYETQYRVVDDEIGARLWQRRDAQPDEYPMAGGVAIPLVRGVIGLEIEAYDGEQWFEQWDSDEQGLPQAVGLTVMATGYRDGGELWDSPWTTLRTVVPIDRVLEPRDHAEEEELALRELEDQDAAAAAGVAGDAAGVAVDGQQRVAPDELGVDTGVAGGNLTIDSDGRIVVNGDGVPIPSSGSGPTGVQPRAAPRRGGATLSDN